MSTTSTSDSGLVDALTVHWRRATGTGWRAWLEYLVPREERADPRFRKSMTRLSVIGLRAIAAVCLGGSLLWMVLGPVFVPGSLSGFGAVALIGFLLVGLSIGVLSFWRPAQSRARLLGLLVLALLPMLDLLGSLDVDVTSGERWAFLAASMIMMMLVAIAALPVLPLQMTAFGVAFIAIYAATIFHSGFTLWDGGAASVAFVFMMMALLTSTGLTMVVYYQRVAAYRARRAAQRAFEDLRDAQVRVNVSENAASQSQFAAALSHELNTPLGSLASAFDTVVHVHERERAHPEMREKLERVWADAARSGRESSSRLRETIERMNRLTNLDRAEEQTVDLNDLWRDTVALLSGTLERAADVELALGTLPPVRCRPQQIAAVFSNLLRNAAAAMSERGHIRISTEHRGEDIILEVRDDGRGMPEAQVRSLFNPTFHIGEERVATTNWGLFVCRSIVTEHRGVIEIESEEGVGTTARIVLPRPDAPGGGVAAAMTMLVAVIGSVVLVGIAAVAFTLWAQRWGATDAECSMPMTGDAYLAGGPRAKVRMTRAVTIDAPPETVWPWLAQLGRGAGWYSYDVLDNGSKASARHIVSWIPEPHRGDASPIGYLRHIAPGSELTWWVPGVRFVGSDARAVFDIRLRPDGARSRLVIRISAGVSGVVPWFSIALTRFLDSVMARRELIGIRDRVERYGARTTNPDEPETGARDQYQHYQVIYASGDRAGTPGKEQAARYRRAAIEAGVLPGEAGDVAL